MHHYTYMVRLKQPTDARCLYIGVRSSECAPEKDDYFGSSHPLKRWIAEHGADSVEKIVLARWPDRAQALTHEIVLHDCFDVGANPKFWNQAKQVSTGFDTAGTTQDVELCIRKSLKTRGRPKSAEHRQKIARALKGRRMSEAQRQLLSDVKKGKPSSMRGVPINKGVPKSPEHRAKIGAANKGKKRSPETCALYSLLRKGKTPGFSETRYANVECPCCGKVGMKANMKRYHFDNCRSKEVTP